MNKENYFGMYIYRKNQFILQIGKSYDGIKLRSDYKFIAQCLIENMVVDINPYNNENLIPIDDCKLILRPFEDMTAKELQAFDKVSKSNLEVLTGKAIGHFISYSPLETEYLISIGIDVFNLKDRDMAVYESDIEKGVTE